MFRGREGKEYWKKLYILLSCNENKSAPTECVNDDFSKNGWALWEVHSPWHLQWKSSSLWIWQDFALARKQILANISQAPVLTVFRYEIFRDRGLENGSLARVPDAGKKKKTFGIRLEYPHLLPRNEDRITTLTVQDADVTRGGKNKQPTSYWTLYASFFAYQVLFNLQDNTGIFTAIFIFIILFIYWLCRVFTVVCRLSLVVASASSSLVAMCRLLVVVAPLRVKHRF